MRQRRKEEKERMEAERRAQEEADREREESDGVELMETLVCGLVLITSLSSFQKLHQKMQIDK